MPSRRLSPARRRSSTAASRRWIAWLPPTGISTPATMSGCTAAFMVPMTMPGTY